MDAAAMNPHSVNGEFIDRDGERWYRIQNVDRLKPFFINLVSSSDHWLFISSLGGLTAGRVSPETALFPYVTVDKIHESASHTGSKTLMRVIRQDVNHHWEPFNLEHNGRYKLSRNLYKNLPGNKVLFEETNHDLELTFSYSWLTSEEFGFIRDCKLVNSGGEEIAIEIVDGLQNILPAGTPRALQASSSNLVDAYKWNELDAESGLALYTLYSGITDRAEPCESLKANTVFSLGFETPGILLSSGQLDRFKSGESIPQLTNTRGVRGCYLVHDQFRLGTGSAKSWKLVADIEQSQSDVVSLQRKITLGQVIEDGIMQSVFRGSDSLGKIMASADAFQSTNEESVTAHHYANVMFNILRGGIFDDQYRIDTRDLSRTVRHFNIEVFERHRAFLKGLPEKLPFDELIDQVDSLDDTALERLCREYLPITFGRRHGDPSRPWNQFSIRLRDEFGDRLLSYEGNWRDIFQNWEALALSYPEFIESMVAKFVNASTPDGYNPYRITKQGIDWEIEDPEDPWSYIGYWGDHQIIYLLKLLELSRAYHPDRLHQMLRMPAFAYANVPYRIRGFDALLADPKSTVEFDDKLAAEIEARVERLGADGKLVLTAEGKVYQVNLLEKLLVPLMAKLSNLVIEGGIWLNTQRPEWNDANNALVGQGLSMVTLYYIRRYLNFMLELLKQENGSVSLSRQVRDWVNETADTLTEIRSNLASHALTDEQRFSYLKELGEAACRYRRSVYTGEFGVQADQSLDQVNALLKDAMAVVDHCIVANKRDDGMYNAYNLMDGANQSTRVKTLYPMLEGQVAVLSSGKLAAAETVDVVESLFDSDLFRQDQLSFMLYPDRDLPSFLQKNRISEDDFSSIPVFRLMLDDDEKSIINVDDAGNYRFNADLVNVGALIARLGRLESLYGDQIDQSRDEIIALYETVFNHREFTGRSGGMFGFEGLGCIYWHMVSKLLLAVQESYFSAIDAGEPSELTRKLGELYYRVRQGIGFNKTPAEYGAFPTDPYSHTPKHSGARQPGMTGQVKEEILTRFGELGLRVRNGCLHFEPSLLTAREFCSTQASFCYLDVDGSWQTLDLPEASLAFTCCQVPVVYQLSSEDTDHVAVTMSEGQQVRQDHRHLSTELSKEIFCRTGMIREIRVRLDKRSLFAG